MPMAPGQPLYLMWTGVNRITPAGNLRAPDQRVSRLGALKAVTLDAAYSLRLEKDVGSIVPGKLANFTILADNPVTIDPMKIKDIKVWGTVQEGRVLPVRGAVSAEKDAQPGRDKASGSLAATQGAVTDDTLARLVTDHLVRVMNHGH
jgi:adenine deaminase